MEHLKLVDEKLYFMIIEFYKAEEKKDVCNKWIDLCKYILNELGNIDIKNYQVVTNLQRK